MPFGRHYSPLEEKSRIAINIAIATKKSTHEKTSIQTYREFSFLSLHDGLKLILKFISI